MGPPRAPRPSIAQGGYPPGPPQDRAWHRGCQSPPPGPTGPCTRSRSGSPLCTRSGRSPPTPLGCCTAGVSGNEPRGSRSPLGRWAMPSLWCMPLPQARLQSAPRVNDLSGWLGCAASRSTCDPACSCPAWVPLLRRSPPNYANRPLGVASCPPAPLGLAAPRSGQTGAALRLLRFARRGSDSGLEPSHSPLRALILGGVRRGAPCGGPKSALRTPPAVQSPGGVGGLRPLA